MPVFASSRLVNSVSSTFDVFGSNTSRTGCVRSDSSRALSSIDSINCFSRVCSGVSDFLPGLFCGLAIASISSSTFFAEVPGGSSTTTICHWPRARRSMLQRARTRTEPRPVVYASLSSARGVMICAPPGKSGPLMCFIRPVMLRSGSRIIAIAAAATSFRLWLGISVAMPTAMPDAPFSNTTGKRAGRIVGSSRVPS